MPKARSAQSKLLPTPPVAGQAETVEAMLVGSKRSGQAVPIRSSFVQQGTRGSRTAGPLASFVGARDEVALDLFLLVLAGASAPPHDIMRAAQVWIRALNRSPNSKSSASVLSRAWQRLEGRRLIARQREGRAVRISLLTEDGSGQAYTYPRGSGDELYFKLPFSYWRSGFHNTLTLRSKAMLLVALSLADDFSLPFERVPEWYGISADTAQRGISELEKAGLLRVTTGYKAAPLTAQGWTEDRRYSVSADFRRGSSITRRHRRAGKSASGGAMSARDPETRAERKPPQEGRGDG